MLSFSGHQYQAIEAETPKRRGKALFSQFRLFPAILAGIALLSVVGFMAHTKSGAVSQPLSGSSAVVTKHASPSGLICQVWENAEGKKVSSMQQVMSTAVTEKMEVSFTMKTPSSLPRGWGGDNVLQIGTGSKDRVPYVYINNNLQNNNNFVFQCRTQSRGRDIFTKVSGGQSYDVKWSIDAEGMELYMGGQLAMTREISQSELQRHLRSEEVPVYVGWSSAATGVTVQNLRVCAEPSKTEEEPPKPTQPACAGGYPYTQQGGDVRVGTDQILFTADYCGNDLDLSFYATVDSGSNKGYLLFVGDGFWTEQPSVWWETNGDLKIRFETQGGGGYNTVISGAGVTTGVKHLIQVKVRGNAAEVFVDGESKKSFTVEAKLRSNGSNRPVYAGYMGQNLASATISGASLCTFGTPACTNYKSEGSTRVAKNKVLFSADYLGSDLDLCFYAKVDSGSKGGYLALIGDGFWMEQPSVMWETDGDLKVRFETESGGGYNTVISDAEVATGTKYRIEVRVRGNSAEVLVNGKSLQTFSVEAKKRSNGSNRPVYAGYMGNSLASATVYDLAVCAYGAPACTAYKDEGSTRVATDNVVFTADYAGDILDLSFYAKVDSGSGKGYLIFVGDDFWTEQPSVWWETNGDLKVRFETKSGGGYNTVISGAGVSTGVEHRIEVQVRGNSAEVFVDGRSKKSFSVQSKLRSNGSDRKVYAGYMGGNLASATVRDVFLCSY